MYKTICTQIVHSNEIISKPINSYRREAQKTQYILRKRRVICPRQQNSVSLVCVHDMPS